MNRHLTDEEIVHCLDRDLPQERTRHVATCDLCRSRVDLLRAMLDEVERAEPSDIPEPSPLFWDHFSRRLNGALADEPRIRRAAWMKRLVPVAAGLVLWVGAFAVGTRMRSSAPPDTPGAGEVASRTAPVDADDPLDLDADVDWSLVQVAADDLEWEAAADAGISANPGSAERVALEMSGAERRELERLIEAEMKQTGA